ncbi:LIC12628 family protein [Leptospira adleri]|uniref:LIC12628 family protein n=1 Tax=Leptospira adleri TaxID=2023186 RepID=UPI000C297AC0|nr:hypothetical protein [Leptospira adleri]
MIISWDKIRHQHPKEEWKELLCKVDSAPEEGNRGSSRVFFGRTSLRREISPRKKKEFLLLRRLQALGRKLSS